MEPASPPREEAGIGTADAARPADATADAGRPTDAATADARTPAASDAAPATPADASQRPGGTDTRSSSAPPPPSPSLKCPRDTVFPNPLPADTQAKWIKGGFVFIEGPLWLPAQGVLLFSDIFLGTANQPNGPDTAIRRFTPPDRFDVFVEHSGSNGLALANDGRVMAASHDVQSLSLFDPQTGRREVRPLTYHGLHFNAPNDLAVHTNGNVYFTDPDYQIGPRASQTGVRGVYRVSPQGEVTLIDDTLTQPNGIALSPDEHTLYVGSADQEIVTYPVADDGTVGSRSYFATSGPSDGLSVDCAGNLYVTGGTVQVFDAKGKKLGDIHVAEEPKNVAFGGTDQKTLFITAVSSLYSIQLNVPGRCY